MCAGAGVQIERCPRDLILASWMMKRRLSSGVACDQEPRVSSARVPMHPPVLCIARYAWPGSNQPRQSAETSNAVLPDLRRGDVNRCELTMMKQRIGALLTLDLSAPIGRIQGLN